MTKFRKTWCATAVAAFAMSCGYAAAPVINTVVNTGSSDARLNPGGDASVYGSNFGASLSTGTTVNVGGSAAYVIYVSPTQINIEIPPTLATGPSTVTVTVPGNGSSNAFAITLVAYAPSFGYTTFAPPGPIVALNAGNTFIGPGSKARPNQFLVVILFGLGPTNPAEPLGVTPSSGTLYNTTTKPTVMIDNITTAPAIFSGLSPGLVGTYQVNLRVPSGAKPGKDPVALSIGGFNTDPGTLYIGAIDRDFAGTGRSDALIYDPAGQSYTALSNGDGTYAYVGNLVSPSFDTLLTGDFNGDGLSDLVLYNSKTASAYIGLGKGDGTFNFQSLFWSPGYDDIEIGDIDGDGTTDFALYNSTNGTLYTAISNGSGGFTYQYHLVSIGLSFVRLADINGDGKADLILYNKTDGTAAYGIGDGTGNFAFTTALYSPGYDIGGVGDLNNDGKADFILYNSSNGNAATFISGGAITPLVISSGFTSVRLADYAGNGKASVTLYNKNTGVNNAYFGVGNGDGTFTFQSLFWSPGYNVVDREDVNGDGKADVVLYNKATGTEYTAISKGNGTFTYTYSYWGIGKLIAQ